MAKLSMKLKQSRPAKFSTRAYTRCRICGRPHRAAQVRRVPCASVSWPTRARSGREEGFLVITRGLDNLSDIRPGQACFGAVSL